MSVMLHLFAKYPLPGFAKTRLIPALGPDGAAALHRHLAARTLRILQASNYNVIVHYTGAELTDFQAWLGQGTSFQKQVEGDLTARLTHALCPTGPQIFFGADTPELSIDHVNRAVAALDNADIVIGPAEDGGYYLIGMNAPQPALFIDIAWSTDLVATQTRQHCEQMRLRVAELDILADCDRPEDLARWPQLQVEAAQ